MASCRELQVVWANPHDYLFLTVTDEDGATENWAVELSPPHALARAGFTMDTLRDYLPGKSA